MPCVVNSILKLKPAQGYPSKLEPGECHQARKEGYRIIPLDVPIPLVDDQWIAHADIKIRKLVWEKNQTILEFEVHKVYPIPDDRS